MENLHKIREREYDTIHLEEKRSQYVKNLKSKTDFDKTVLDNNKKIKHPVSLKETVRSLKPSEWAIIIICSIFCGVLGFSGTKVIYKEAKYYGYGNINQKGKTEALIIVTLLCCLSGLAAMVGASKLAMQKDKRDDIKDVYNRLSVYLFDYLKTVCPDLDGNMLHKYNPALAEVITALLIANMDKKDTEKLSAVAYDLVNKVKSQKIDINEYKTTIDYAIGIIKNALNNNKRLHNSIVLAYKGWATSTFYVDAKSSTNYIYIAGNTRQFGE